MINLHEETKSTVFEVIIIFIIAMAAMVVFALILDTALEKTAENDRARLDAQITPEQRADVIGRGK